MIRAMIAIVLFACFVLSCATVPTSNMQQINIQKLDINPVQCVELSLRTDVPIKTEIIYEPSIMLKTLLLVLRYREGGDEKVYTPDLRAGYNNVSLVSEVKTDGDNPLIVYRRYCVVEMWRFYPNEKEKVCYLWTIESSSASMKVLLEGLGGEFIDERVIPLNPLDVAKLKAFYEQLAKSMIDLLKEPIPYTKL